MISFHHQLLNLLKFKKKIKPTFFPTSSEEKSLVSVAHVLVWEIKVEPSEEAVFALHTCILNNEDAVFALDTRLEVQFLLVQFTEFLTF